MNKILNGATDLLKGYCMITGGHYKISFEDNNLKKPCLNPGTLKSFILAVELYKIAATKGINADLGLLINDIGASAYCEDDHSIGKTKLYRDNYNLPEEYSELLESNGINKESIRIFWEKKIRNKGKKIFLKMFKAKNNNIEKNSKGYFINDNNGYGKIVLTRESDKDKYGIPACPLIMASLNMIQDKYYSSNINFYYIGDDNIENIPNYFVIEKGKRVSEILGSHIKVNNIYFNNINNMNLEAN